MSNVAVMPQHCVTVATDFSLTVLRTALRVAPDYVDAIFNLALLLQGTNQYAEAADYWRHYLASDCQSDWAAAGGSTTTVSVNGGRTWENGETHAAVLTLPTPAPRGLCHHNGRGYSESRQLSYAGWIYFGQVPARIQYLLRRSPYGINSVVALGRGDSAQYAMP
jgi:hypothetical protein